MSLPIFDAGDDARGFIAVGQLATGFIAFGQFATGVIAIGQFARGVICIGQFAIGVYAVGMFAAGLISAAGAGIAPRFYGAGLSLLPGTRARIDVPVLRRLAELAGGTMAWVRVRFGRTEDARLELTEDRVPIAAHVREPLASHVRAAVMNEPRDFFAFISRTHDGRFIVQRVRETGEPTASDHNKRRGHWVLGGGAYVILVVAYFFLVIRPIGELLAEIF